MGKHIGRANVTTPMWRYHLSSPRLSVLFYSTSPPTEACSLASYRLAVITMQPIY
jgi:hypothetical protein